MSYITQIGKRYLKKPLESYPAEWGNLPGSAENFYKDYLEAERKMIPTPKALRDEYMSLVGAIGYTPSRPEICYYWGILCRCLTFATSAMLLHATRVLVYLMRTKNLGLLYSGKGEGAGQPEAYSDSDWETTRSCTGYGIKLAGALITWYSRRQHCIALSSTEAELMAMGACAREMLYVKFILEDLLVIFTTPFPLFTDNKGSYDLCHRYSSGQHSRHVNRQYFKARELRGGGIICIIKVDTGSNWSDIFTKAVSVQLFKKHVASILGMRCSSDGSAFIAIAFTPEAV